MRLVPLVTWCLFRPLRCSISASENAVRFVTTHRASSARLAGCPQAAEADLVRVKDLEPWNFDAEDEAARSPLAPPTCLLWGFHFALSADCDDVRVKPCFNAASGTRVNQCDVCRTGLCGEVRWWVCCLGPLRLD